jgi:hypothetical protein
MPALRCDISNGAKKCLFKRGAALYATPCEMISVRAFFVRLICSRASLRREMSDRQMPGVSDRHEAKTEAQSPPGQRRDDIRKT